MKWNPWNTSIGLALGGGAARGIAHIGVLRAFEEAHIELSAISGTSIGSLIAAYHAFGKSSSEIEKIAPELNFKKVFSLGFNKLGLLDTNSIYEMIERDLGQVNIEDAQIKLAIATTDIETGELIVFRRGPLTKAVCASVAVPGIFTPVSHEGRLLVDGGINENVPLSCLQNMGAGISVGIDLNATPTYRKPEDLFTVLGNAMDIAIDLRTRDQMKDADIVCGIDCSSFNRLDNSDKIAELIDLGKEKMQKKMNSLLWLQKTNYFQFLKKLFWEVIPLKIPRLFRSK